MARSLKGAVANGPGTVIDLGEAYAVGLFHIWCDGATASASVQIESTNDPAGEPWAPAVTHGQGATAIPAVVNPTAVGVFQAVDGRFVRATVSSWVSGGINATCTVKPT